MSINTPKGLRFKLVIIVVIGIATAFTLVGGVRVYAERQRIVDEMRQSGQERAELLAEAVANLLIAYDYSNMESLAERVVEQQDVQQVVIRNQQGKVMVIRNAFARENRETLSFDASVLFDGNPIGRVSLDLSLARLEADIVRTYRQVIMEQVIFGLLLGLLIYLTTSRVIVKPITRISQHMQAILATDDASAPHNLTITSQDEIGELAHIFNELNAKVREAQGRLRDKIHLADSALLQSNAQLQQRTEELERRGQDLEHALYLVEKLAITDSLTELRNRRYFDDSLASAFARAQRFNESMTLALVDVDYFKKINDTHGHAAGDTVLQSLADLFRERTRETDIAARMGGDEFAFLLFHASRQQGELFSQEVLERARRLEFTFNGEVVRLGLSIGLACNQDGIQSVEALYGVADEALYEAKRRGRNQVVAYPFKPKQTPPTAEIVAFSASRQQGRPP